MPLLDFVIKRNDRRPALAKTLTDSAGNPVDLTGSSVKLIITAIATGTVKVNTAASIVNPPGTDGKVSYAWAAGNTDTPGDYWGEFEVTFGDGTKESFPNDRHMRIRVTEELG